MKATELRIGNLVKLPTSDNSEYPYIIVASDYCECCNTGIEITSMRPLPLTEEWLVRLGFVGEQTDPEYNRYYNKGDYIVEIPFDNSAMTLSNVSEDLWIPTNIQYVHQLQNLYFALTGEELTIK